MVSPIFLSSPGSRWREDVEVTWRYLSRNYDVAGSHRAGTHIHVGLVPDYTLLDLKRVAQAVIHFEPALEALVPLARRENWHAKSNWLDAPWLARKNKSRAESIAIIEKIQSSSALVYLLHPATSSGRYDRCFSWNFCSYHGKRSIEFRKPPASLTSKEVLSWAELAMSFVQAATWCESPQAMEEIPATVGGLRWFLRKYANVPGMNQPARLERLWRGLDPEMLLAPKPQVEGLQQQERIELEAKLRSMAVADRRRIEELAKTAKGRYW
jgi:Putative amidoligase enzyme